MEAVRKVGCAYTVHTTGTGKSVDAVHGAVAQAARMRSAWMMLRLRALLNTEQRCVQGCSKLHETGCIS